MKRLDHLLAVLAEEACEIGQAAMKAQRFGLSDGCPGTDRTNRTDILIEFGQLAAVIDMLCDAGEISEAEIDAYCEQAFRDKKVKVEKFLDYSRQQGRLDD